MHPAGGRRSAAGHEALPQRRRGAAVLSAPRAGRAARRPHAKSSASSKQRPQIIGGSLKTLLYMTQLAAISQDPVVLARRAPGVRRLRGARPRSVRRRAVRARARRRALDSRRARRAGRGRRRRRRPAPTACTSTSRCRRARRTRPACSTARSSRRSSRRSIRRWRRPSAASRRGASASTSTACRTSSARRWPPPTARAPATTPAYRRR